jgi:multidrug efflux pump subunit AcrA (membrane-fusion protein)
MFMRDIASWIAIGAALISACVGLYATAGGDFRDQVEKVIPGIRGGQTAWAAWAAIAAAVSVVAQAMEKLPV